MSEKRAYLLSGAPGSGKTTLIMEAVASFPGRAGGFYTREIRSQGGRQGFEIVALTGERAVLASVHLQSPFRVGKYGVDVASLERVGVAALREALRSADLLVIDEIGKMELCSASFREAATEALASGQRVLGTILLAPHPWADEIKRLPQVRLLVLSRHNRPQVAQEVSRWLQSGKQAPC